MTAGEGDEQRVDDRVDSRSWDEFWSEIERTEAAARGEGATTVIRGVRVPVPHDLPLRFDRVVEQMERAGDEEGVRRTVTDLFGADVFEQWVDAGMTNAEFEVVLLWGMANGRGRPLSFAEAYEAVKTQGKSLAPNRTARRASARSGGASKPTSAASTGSRPRK